MKPRFSLNLIPMGHTGTVPSVSFSPDGSMLASGAMDDTVKLWDVVAQEEITTLKGHRWGAKAVSFSSDGSMLASGSGSGEIKLWDVATRENIATYSGHRGGVDSVSFSPDGKILATGSSDTSIKLWHVPTLAEIGALKGHSHWVEEVSFSPDGAILASGAQNAVAMIWDVSEWTGERIRATTEIYLPDPNLRTAMADTLGQPSSAPIFRETMVVLIDFDAPAASISDLTGLESAINLRELNLGNNNISDISAVEGLTKLTKLNLENNNISDISPLEGLTKLTELYLGNNNISDILYPGINDIPDISPLEGLTELTKLSLGSNDISDLAPLEANIGLNDGDEVNVRRNSLSYPSIYKYIPTLQGRGVEVIFDHRVPQRIRIVSGNDQEGLPGGALANPFVVEVLDENGVAFEGVPIMFAVTSGGGTLSTTGATTDSDGRAESTLTLGQNPGTNTVEVSATGVKGKVILSVEIRNEFDLFLRKGINLIHLPLRVTTVNGVPMTIESISDLYDVLGGAMAVNVLLTRDPAAQQWRSYFGAQDKGASGDKALTDDLGIIAVMKNAVTVQLKGDALGTEGSSEIKLHPGTNLVGVPLRDSRIARVSGLLSLEGVRNNVRAIIVPDNREFKVVGRTGDEGDIPVIGGQSFVLTAREAATIAISGEGWNNVSGVAAAAPIALAGVEAGDTTPILALKGSIVSPVGTRDRMSRLQSGSGFRVILKNLSTGKAVATFTKDERLSPSAKANLKEIGYQLALVDIESGRAAQVGDALEISAESSILLIRVQLMRYTVTVDDVKNSRIQLPDLVGYEIPSQTELLSNYPNPFNPETWIPYRLAGDADVSLTIYDTKGVVVRRLDLGHQLAGFYTDRAKAAYWDGQNENGEPVASGIYFYELATPSFRQLRRLVILK